MGGGGGFERKIIILHTLKLREQIETFFKDNKLSLFSKYQYWWWLNTKKSPTTMVPKTQKNLATCYSELPRLVVHCGKKG